MNNIKIDDIINAINLISTNSLETIKFKMFCSEKTWRHLLRKVFSGYSDEMIQQCYKFTFDRYLIMWFRDETMSDDIFSVEEIKEDDSHSSEFIESSAIKLNNPNKQHLFFEHINICQA